jgi:hypothetical protein
MLSETEAIGILAAGLAQPAGTELVFAALAKVPGIEHDPGHPGGRFRSAVAPALRVGDWTFSPAKSGTAIDAAHTVRGVILSRSTVSAPDAAARLAPELLDTARRHGNDAQDYVESVLRAIAELLE